MQISGFNGGNGILAVNAKLRVEKGWFDGACIKGKNKQFVVLFTGKDADWKGEPLFLCSTRSPHEPRIFKSIDGAVSELERIGINNVQVIVSEALDIPHQSIVGKEKMKFCLKVRPFEEKDIGTRAYFIPKPDDFERYLQAFIEDIELLDTVEKIIKCDDSLDFIIETQCSKGELVELIQDIYKKPFQYKENIKWSI